MEDTYYEHTEVQEHYRDLTPDALRIMRHRGTGPVYMKPAGTRRIYYAESDIRAWLNASKRISTREPVSA